MGRIKGKGKEEQGEAQYVQWLTQLFKKNTVVNSRRQRGHTGEGQHQRMVCGRNTAADTRKTRAMAHRPGYSPSFSLSLYCFKLTHLADDPAVVVGSSSGGLVLLRSYAVDALPPPSLLLLLLGVPLLAVFSRHTTSF